MSKVYSFGAPTATALPRFSTPASSTTPWVFSDLDLAIKNLIFDRKLLGIFSIFELPHDLLMVARTTRIKVRVTEASRQAGGIEIVSHEVLHQLQRLRDETNSDVYFGHTIGAQFDLDPDYQASSTLTFECRLVGDNAEIV